MSMVKSNGWGCERTRSVGLEVWVKKNLQVQSPMDGDEKPNPKNWWEVRRNGVCLAQGGGSDEAPDAAVCRLYEEIQGVGV